MRKVIVRLIIVCLFLACLACVDVDDGDRASTVMYHNCVRNKMDVWGHSQENLELAEDQCAYLLELSSERNDQ
jgi:hypothetical protein